MTYGNGHMTGILNKIRQIEITDETDENGWKYGFDFENAKKNKQTIFDYCRSRKWFKTLN